MVASSVSIRSASITFNYSGGALSSRTMDPHERVDILAKNGYAVMVDGVTPNSRLDGTTHSDLFQRAPSGEVYPAITFAPSSTGKIFGNQYKWRIRFRNSETGECTGLSPVPSVGMNLGVVTSGASFMGQTAYFLIEGRATTTGLDTIDFFRNVSEDAEVYFLLGSKTNPGAGLYASFTDNNPDEDLYSKEVNTLRPGFTYNEGVPPPYARVYEHPSGRAVLYGVKRQGNLTGSGATCDAGSVLVTVSSGRLHRGREGQSFRWTLTDTAKQVFRIVEVLSATTMNVNVAPAVAQTGAWEIVDDRDGRNAQLLSPVSPVQGDPTEVLTIGRDISDDLVAMFDIRGVTGCLTRHRLIVLDNDKTSEPHFTYEQTVVSDDGCVGFWAWCITPYGVVYMNDRKGIMVYEGDGLPRCLGRPQALLDFEPKAEFESIDRSLMSESYLYWDPFNDRVMVSYVYQGKQAEDELLSFDPTTGSWRGPWRRRVYSAGRLRNATGEDTFVQGDDFAQLLVDGAIAADVVVDPSAGAARTVSAFSGNAITFTGTAVSATCGYGVPLLFHDGSGNWYINWVGAYISSDTIHLWMVPEVLIAPGWTFLVGYIHWRAKTGYLDLSEPGQPKHLGHLTGRYQRMVTSVDNLVIQAASEGETIAEGADTTAQTQTQGLVKFDANLNCGGNVFQVRLSGRATYGGPKVTDLFAKGFDIRSGTAIGLDGDNKKVVVTPTAST